MNIRIPFFYTYLNLFIYFCLFICFSNTMFDNFIKIYFHHFYYLQHRLKINPIICSYASSFLYPHIEQTLICFEQFIDQNLIIPWSNIKTWMYIIHTYIEHTKKSSITLINCKKHLSKQMLQILCRAEYYTR